MKMMGILSNNGKEWVVSYSDFMERVIPLYHKDVEKIDIMFQPTHTQEVDFEIVDEFSHEHLFYNVGWGEGPPCAKLITNVLK
jgi:hypothetical protein